MRGRWGEEGAEGWSRKQRRDFERGSVVEVVVAEVVGEGGDGEGRERRKRRWRRHRVSWRKRWQGGREREYRGEEKEETVGPGGGLPSYRRDPAKILRDLSLLLQVGLAYFSSAFDQVLQSREKSNPEKWLTDRTDDPPDAGNLVIHTRRLGERTDSGLLFFRKLIITNCEYKMQYKNVYFLSFFSFFLENKYERYFLVIFFLKRDVKNLLMFYV